MPFDLADAGDEPVGRGALYELLHVAPPPLGGDHQRPVLHKRAWVTKIVDVLPSGPLP